MLVSFERAMQSYEGDEAEVDREIVEARLDEAERLLFRLCPASRHLIDSPADRPFLEDVIIRAVLRTVRDTSPGLKSENLGNYAYTKDSLTQSGNVWFGRDDLAALPCGGGARIGTVRISADSTFANTRPRRVARAGGWW